MAKKNRPTIRTVAEYVDLSPTTVSLALRGDRSIPFETRQRVLEAAEELNYNYVPRSRKPVREKLCRVAFVTKDYGDHPVSSNPFYGQILSGVELCCRTEQASLSFAVLPHDLPLTTPLPHVLKEDIDGILLTSPYPESVIERVARESRCPILLIDNEVAGSPFDSVMADDFGGGYQATQHLIDAGHRNILAVTGRTLNPEIAPSFRERYRGYTAACEANDAPAHPAVVLPPPADEFTEKGREKLQQWLTSFLESEREATAFFCVGDTFAINLIYALRNLGQSIPDDFSVVGFDDYDLASMTDPPLTTMHAYKRTIGQIAVERLLERIKGDDRPPMQITVGTKIVTRGSVGPPPKRSSTD